MGCIFRQGVEILPPGGQLNGEWAWACRLTALQWATFILPLPEAGTLLSGGGSPRKEGHSV